MMSFVPPLGNRLKYALHDSALAEKKSDNVLATRDTLSFVGEHGLNLGYTPRSRYELILGRIQ